MIELKAPMFAESISEGTLVQWHKKVGDAVQQGEMLADIETDKVTLEITAPSGGVLQEIVKLEGDAVLSEEVLARINDETEAVVQTEESAPIKKAHEPEQQEDMGSNEVKLSPGVRYLLDEHGLSVASIKRIKTDRLTVDDVQAHLRALQNDIAQTPAEKPAVASFVLQDRAEDKGVGTEKRIPMTRLRQTIASRLLSAQRDCAILTTFNQINMTALLDLRKKYNEAYFDKYQVKLGMMSFFCKAVVQGLKQFPIINSRVAGTDIVEPDYYNISIAVSSPRGLVVPVLRNVDRISIADIELQIRDFAERARDAKLSIDELSGGTFTITNGGVFGSLLSTPIINPPQSAILGLHSLQKTPVVENDQIVIGTTMYVALSYDHRIIDGKEAVRFLVTIKEQIEDPIRLMLEV